jgi:ornithine carbamoyltransferase
VTTKRDFLTLSDLLSEAPDALETLIDRAIALKAARERGERGGVLAGKSVALIFEKASTRTRVAFEVGVFELGGHAVVLSAAGSQLGRGEPLEDTARVLAGYCHAIVIRTFGQDRVETLARWSPVPVINGLTDQHHPCQIVADLMTVKQRRGAVHGLRYAWIGDGNNMASSWIEAAGMLGLDLVLACPDGYRPDPAVLATARARLAARGAGRVEVVARPEDAAAGADVISTDVWASMGQEDEAAARRRAFAGYCVDAALLRRAAAQPIVLHCLPAHRGEEIAADVIDDPGSAVWQQAENRLHTQKAILEWVLAAARP